MGILDKIKETFKSSKIPEDTLKLVTKAEDVKSIRKTLNNLLGKNEIELKKTEEELISTSRSQLNEKEIIKKEGLTPDEEKTILRRIMRKEKKLVSIRNKINILNANVTMQQNMILKIDEFEAMELQGVNADLLDDLSDKEYDRIEDFREVENAAHEIMRSDSAISNDKEEEVLAKMKREIMGTKPEVEKEKKKTETPVNERLELE